MPIATSALSATQASWFRSVDWPLAQLFPSRRRAARSRRLRRSCTHAYVLQPIALDLTIERRKVDPQSLGRADLVALHAGQNLPNMLAFEFLQRHPRAIARGRRRNRLVGELVGQIMSVKDVGFGQDGGALDSVFQLTHVARPRITDHHAHRAFRKTHRGPPELL